MNMVRSAQRKSPVLAALLNFFTFGGGYIYLGKRRAFGTILVAAFVAMTIEYFAGTFNLLEHVVTGKNLVDTHSISLTVIAVALAYDGYVIAQGK